MKKRLAVETAKRFCCGFVTSPVIPAQAGICPSFYEVPVFAGMKKIMSRFGKKGRNKKENS